MYCTHYLPADPYTFSDTENSHADNTNRLSASSSDSSDSDTSSDTDSSSTSSSSESESGDSITTPKQIQPSFNERSVITNAVPLLGQQPSNNTQSDQAGSNLSQVIGNLSSNSHVINSPAKLTLAGSASGDQISGDVPYNSYAPNAASSSGASHPTTNSTHDVAAPTVSQSVASTWSKLAQQSGPSQAIESTKTLDSFQQFKKQAKEKMDKEKLIEMQEQRRREREQQEREQQEREQQEKERLTQEQRIDQEGEMALNSLARAEQSPVLSPASDSQSPASGAGTSVGGSSMLKLREQERRKREALASQNQMDLSRQSEIMSKFEDRV